MPFTAYHLGAGLLGKGVSPKSQSLLLFLACQVAIDIEPGVKMLIGSTSDLHQITHHPIGLALTVTACALLWRWAQKQAWWGNDLPVLSWKAITLTAIWAGYSHWMLDSLSYIDMNPKLAGHYGAEFAEASCVGMALIGLTLLGVRWAISAARKALDNPQAQ